MISREEERVEQSWFEREAGTSDTAAAFPGSSDPKKKGISRLSDVSQGASQNAQ